MTSENYVYRDEHEGESDNRSNYICQDGRVVCKVFDVNFLDYFHNKFVYNEFF